MQLAKKANYLLYLATADGEKSVLFIRKSKRK